MSTVLAATADLTDIADAWQRGVPDRVNTVTAEQTDPAIVSQSQATDTDYFPPLRFDGGWKLALGRIMRLGGTFGVPHGPGPSHPRMRRRIPDPPNASTHEQVVTRMPAGLIPTHPAWEDYLYAEGLIAP